MKRILLMPVLLLALGMGGCAEQLDKMKRAYDVVTSMAVSPEAVVVARTAFNTVEVLATNYQRLPRCTGVNGPLCRDPALRDRIDQAIYAGRKARNELTAFMRAHPGALGPQG